MKYFLIALLVLLSQNAARSSKTVKKRNADDSFDINIGAGYGFGSGQTSYTLPRSTTKINHSTTYLSKLLRDEPNINQNYYSIPNTLEVQESAKKFVTEKPYVESWKNNYRPGTHQVREVMNMGDIQSVLHNLDDKSEYSKVLQVVKVPAIYEIHLEKIQSKNPQHQQKKKSEHTQTDKWLQKQNVKTEDIIYGNTRNTKSGFKDYVNIDDWLKDTTGDYNIEENERKKSTSQQIEKAKYHNGQPKLTWSPFIGSEIPDSNFNSMSPHKATQSNNMFYQSESLGTNQKGTPLVYSPEYTTQKKKTSNYNPTDREPLFESTRNIYSVAFSNQPQAMYEVAPPALGNKPIDNYQQPQRPILSSYSTLSPVLPYDLKGIRDTRFFRNTQRSDGSVESISNTNPNGKNFAGQVPDAVNAPVKPGMAAVFSNQDTDSIDENYNKQFNSYDEQVYASSRIDNIHFTTDRPEKKTFRSLSRGPKYIFPDIFRTRGNRRSGEPLRYVLYIKEKYSDEDDRK